MRAAIRNLVDVSRAAPVDTYVLTYSAATGLWYPAPPGGAGAGEANTASNLGSGNGIYVSKSGVDLRFKSLIAGTNITLTATGTDITVAASGGSVPAIVSSARSTTADTTIATGYGALVVGDLEVGTGFVLELASDSVLEIT